MPDEPQECRVLLVGFSPVVTRGLLGFFEGEEKVHVVGEVKGQDELATELPRLGPNIILTELRDEELDGVAVARLARQHDPKMAIIVLTASPHDEYILDVVRAGACGYLLLHQATRETLLDAMRLALRGGATIHADLLHRIIDSVRGSSNAALREAGGRRASLTPRELAVLRLVIKGHTNREIGATLKIAPETIKRHVQNIMAKLGARRRAEAAAIAARAGLSRRPSTRHRLATPAVRSHPGPLPQGAQGEGNWGPPYRRQ